MSSLAIEEDFRRICVQSDCPQLLKQSIRSVLFFFTAALNLFIHIGLDFKTLWDVPKASQAMSIPCSCVCAFLHQPVAQTLIAFLCQLVPEIGLPELNEVSSFFILPNLFKHLGAAGSLSLLVKEYVLCSSEMPHDSTAEIIDTDEASACSCSSGSWRGSTSGRCSGNARSRSLSGSWTHDHSTAAHIHPGPGRSCCTSVRTSPWCRSCHCMSRSLATSQNRPGPWQTAACELGSRAPGAGGGRGGRRGCSPCWRKPPWRLHQSGPSGSRPLCGSWAAASNRCARCRSLTCHGTCTPGASQMKRSGKTEDKTSAVADYRAKWECHLTESP